MIKAREEKNSADITLRILQSAVIVLALFAKIRVLPHDGSEYPLIAFLAKTRDSFEEMSFASPLVFILFLLLLRETRRRRLKNNWQLVVISGVCAFLRPCTQYERAWKHCLCHRKRIPAFHLVRVHSRILDDV